MTLARPCRAWAAALSSLHRPVPRRESQARRKRLAGSLAGETGRDFARLVTIGYVAGVTPLARPAWRGPLKGGSMLPSVAVRAGELLAAVLAAGAMCLAAAATGVWWLKRRVRRCLEVIGRAIEERAAGAAAGAASAGWRWLWSLPLPDRRWIAAGRARRELWRAVRVAGHAVAVAREAGAPTGDLGALCRRLRRAAADADRSLSVPGRAPAASGELGPVSSQVGDLVTAAGLIRDAAASAVASMSRPAARNLADDARREAVALSAGIASVSRAAAAACPGSRRDLGRVPRRESPPGCDGAQECRGWVSRCPGG